jgi:hypothetical protein
MPSIERRSLSISFRRAEMIAFWILVVATLWLMIGLASAAGGIERPWLRGVVALGIVMPGLIWSPWFEWGVRGWNKSARLTTAALRSYALRVGYYVLIAAVGRVNATSVRGANGASGWVDRRRRNVDEPLHGAFRGWRAALFPVVGLLMLVEDERQESSPSHTSYTLY